MAQLYHVEVDYGAKLYLYHRHAATREQAAVHVRRAHNKKLGRVPEAWVKIIALYPEAHGKCPAHEIRESP